MGLRTKLTASKIASSLTVLFASTSSSCGVAAYMIILIECLRIWNYISLLSSSIWTQPPDRSYILHHRTIGLWWSTMEESTKNISASRSTIIHDNGSTIFIYGRHYASLKLSFVSLGGIYLRSYTFWYSITWLVWKLTLFRVLHDLTWQLFQH